MPRNSSKNIRYQLARSKNNTVNKNCGVALTYSFGVLSDMGQAEKRGKAQAPSAKKTCALPHLSLSILTYVRIAKI